MSLVRIDGLPLNRDRFLIGGGSSVFERRNTDPTSQGEARRTGSQRMWTTLPYGVGISAHPGRGSYVLLDDQTQASLKTCFTGADFSVNLHFLPGAVSVDSTAAFDFTLFRWGGLVGETGSVEIIYRSNGGTFSVFATLTYTGGAITLTDTWAGVLAPGTGVMYTLTVDSLECALYRDGVSKATGTLTDKGVTATMFGETTILGRTARAAAHASGNAVPKGSLPSVTDVSIWNSVVTIGAGNNVETGSRLSAASQASANLIAYVPLSDGGKDNDYGITAETKGTTRAYLCPGLPSVDISDSTTDGVLFSGVGGHIRIPYITEFDQFFTRRTEFSSGGEWSMCVIVRTPEGAMKYPDGTATVVSFGPSGSLLKLEIVESGGSYYFKTTVGTLAGDAISTSAKALDAATRYVVFVSREDGEVNLVVRDDSSTTLSKASVTGTPPSTKYGPNIDEGDVPEMMVGAQYNTSTETWEQRWRGQIKHLFWWNHVAPISVFDSGAAWIRDDEALLAFNFKAVHGDFETNRGTANAIAILERDDISGVEGSPPFWTDGPIRDGQFVSAFSGVALTETIVAYPDDATLDNPPQYSARAKGTLDLTLGTDATGARFGDRIILASGGRAHILNEETNRLRPLGIPKPTARPGQISSSIGPVHGVVCYGYSYRTQDGTESPLRVLPPQAYRQSTVAIGGSEDTPGSKYGESNADSSGTPGYFALLDGFNGGAAGHYDNTYKDGEFFYEAKCRLDPTLLASDFREQKFDRGIDGSSSASWDSFYGLDTSALSAEIDPREPWTIQVVLRPTNMSTVNGEKRVIASIANSGNYAASGPTDPVIICSRGNGTNAVLSVGVSDGNKVSDGWTLSDFSAILSNDTDYSIVITFDGDNFNAYVNEVLDATTVTDLPHAQRTELYRIGVGSTRRDGFPAQLGVCVKAAKATRWYGCRFWARTLPASDIPLTKYVWFDPVEEARMGQDLLRDYKFSTDDPFDKKSRFACRVSAEEVRFYRNNSTNSPSAARGTPYWFPDAKAGRVFTMITATPDTPFSSAFQAMWSRIGNGSLIVTSGSNLYYYAANQALVPGTPTLPSDPQTWNWFGFWLTTSDGATATPDITFNEVWLNGSRLYAGGVLQARNVTTSTADAADIGGMRTLPTGASAVDVHLQEFRGWNSRKYVKEADFEWLLRRVPSNLWSEMIYYYRMFTLSGSDVFNDATDPLVYAGAGTPHDVLDIVGDAALTSISTTGLPTPPWPDITHLRFYRSPVYPVRNFDDNEELDRLKRAARQGPFNLVGEAPVGVSNFLDGSSSAIVALGEPALPEEGHALKRVRGVATWGGVPILWGQPSMTLYVADPNDYENYLPSNYIHVPAAEFDRIVACVEAGDAFYVFGTGGGVIYRGNRPTRQQPSPIGGGVGAATARCVASHGSMAYVLGRAGLFAISGDGRAVDIGTLVNDLLPADPEQASLQVIGESLYVIDESDGDALRLYLPKARMDQMGNMTGWSFEDRSIRAGMFRDDDLFFVHRSGYLAKGRTGYTDDTVSGQGVSGTATGGSSATLEDSTNPFPTTGNGATGQKILLIRAADASSEIQTVTSNTAGALTVASWTGTAPVSGDTWVLGGFEMIVDTGWFGADQTPKLNNIDVVRASGTIEVGYQSSQDALSPTTYTGVKYSSFTTSGRLSIHEAAKFVRVAIRSRTSAAAEAVGVFADLEMTPIDTEASPNA